MKQNISLKVGMAIQSESAPDPTRPEVFYPIRLRAGKNPTPTPIIQSDSELESDRSWTLKIIR